MKTIAGKGGLGRCLAVAFSLAGFLAVPGCGVVAECPPTEGDRSASPGNQETSPDGAARRFESYLSREDFEALFPRRVGSDGWRAEMPHQAFPNWETYDEYYSYDNLLAAIRGIANLKYKIEFRDRQGRLDHWNSRAFVVNKTTGNRSLVFEYEGFNAEWNRHYPVVTQTVDLGAFLARGSENDRRRELAAFLANIAHETGGGWPTAPGGHFSWGLFFNEEKDFAGSTNPNYVDHGSVNFPPVPGRSYHGRGPIQLSWNYNYGLVSAILFEDKNVLLQNPEMVVECGILGFKTAIWFWMTPQSPKPSCHQVMTGYWVPSAQDIAAGRTDPGFGMTIMVINGGLEGNLTVADGRIYSRVGFYRAIAGKTGADITGEKLDTLGMFPW